ncbi:MAG: ShlB/FhaC/HecB family hemolysin secretion/activation protein, partial [Burkholderiaceae bacterium]|nr:ShlB/FhaC/HecB family hemolysin secretion/activation protein [Burkholderiaceae bacterium]
MTYNSTRLLASLAGAVLISCSTAAQAQNEAGNPIGHFEISRYDVSGNTLLPASTVDMVLAPYAGPNKDFGSVQQALEALEAAYRAKGYGVVRVVLPEQELNKGVVHLRVIEARIGKITVTGNKNFDADNIRRSVPNLVEGRTPDLNDVSASLKVANENPAKKTTLQLQTSDRDDQINANLQVQDERPWTAGIAFDNTGDEHTGRNHVTVQYQNANIGGLDHVLSMQYTTSVSDPGAVHVYGAGYHIPLYSLGDSLDLYGSYSSVNSGTVTAGVFDLAVSGQGTVFGARYNHNLHKVGDLDSKLIFGLDYKAYKDDISYLGAPLGNDVTVHPLSLTYTGNWSKNNDTINFYVSAIHNISGGSNGSQGDFNAARANATADYTILRYGASYFRVLPADWQLRFALNGQLTSDALVQGEQFGAGGASSVRGFLEREISDDQGYVFNGEVYTPNVCSGGGLCRFLGFYDAGYVSHNDGLPGELNHQSIGSVGLGWRISLQRYLVFQTDFAH